MSELKIFENAELGSVRVVDKGGDPWFVAKDVAEALGYIWNGASRVSHVPEEWRGVTSVVTPYGTQEMITLSEQGLYFFLGRSDKAKSLPYQKWLAGEVVPSIRKTGGYGNASTPALPDFSNPAEAARAWADEYDAKMLAIARAEEAEKTVHVLTHVNKTYTATEIAKECGLKSANELNKILHDKGIQFQQNGTWVPYSKYSQLGWFEIKQDVLDNGKIIYHRRITGMGRKAIVSMINCDTQAITI